MALGHSPRMVTNGLVLCYDAANASKNATANISTNLITNGNFAGGQGSPLESGSVPTNTIIQMANPGDTGWVLRQNGNYTEYQLNPTGLAANTTYVMSGWYAKSADYTATDTMFHARAFSASGAHTATGADTGTLLYSTVVNGITWQFRYQTITTPADANGTFNWYVGWGADNTVGFRYYTNLRMEKGTFPSIADLSGNNNVGEAVNGVSFSSANGGYLVFDGTNDYINLPYSLLSGGQDFTVNIWLKANPHSYGTIFGNYSAGNLQLFYGPAFMGMWLGNSSAYLSNPSAEFTTNPVFFTGRRINGNETNVYLNAVLKKTGSSTSSIGASNFRIGTNTVNDEVYNGSIAHVSVYGRALSATEIKQNFDATRSRYGI